MHGKEYLCVLNYSACFASEQLNSITTTLAKVTQNLRLRTLQTKANFTEQGIRNKIDRWLSDPFVREVLHYELEQREDHWWLTFDVNHAVLIAGKRDVLFIATISLKSVKGLTTRFPEGRAS